VYRELLATHGLTGSMSRRGNPHDNAKAESFMKTLKVEGRLFGGLRDIRGHHRRPSSLDRRGLQLKAAALGPGLTQPDAVRESTRPADGQSCPLILSTHKGALQMEVSIRRCLTIIGIVSEQMPHPGPAFADAI
jgi:hypothetical protein